MQRDLRVGGWLVQPSLCRISKSDVTVQVRAKVMDLLVYLAEHPGQVVSKDVLLRDVWGTDAISESALTRTIAEMREALGDDIEQPSILETIPKRGYRLIAPVMFDADDEPRSDTTKQPTAAGGGQKRTSGWAPAGATALFVARYLIPGAAVVLAVGVALGVWLSRDPAPSGSRATAHAVLSTAPAEGLARPYSQRPGQTLELVAASGRPSRNALALSPDGRYLVFVGTFKGAPHLFRRAFDRDAAELIPGTEGADIPFISPDSRRLGFWAAGALHWMPIEGGTVQDVVSLNRIRGASWADDQTMVYGIPTGIMRVHAGGGKPEPLTTVDVNTGETWHDFPQVLPGGRNLILTVRIGDELRDAKVVSYRADTRRYTVLAENATDGRLVAGRYLLFMRGGALMGVPFDLESLDTVGPATKLFDDVMVSSNTYHSGLETGAGQFAVSDAGHLVYLRGGEYPIEQSALAWFDRRGDPLDLPVPAEKHSYVGPRLGSDGRIVASLWQTRDQALGGVLIYDPRRKTSERLRFDGRMEWPIWTPDGRSVVFLGTIRERSAIFQAPADRSAPPVPLTPFEASEPVPASWSADGDLVFWKQSGLYKLTKGSGPIAPVVGSKTGVAYSSPSLSADGRWLAYTSNEGGGPEVYVASYPSLRPRTRVSTRGGQSPSWTRRDREIVYYEPVNAETGRLMSVAFVPEGSLPEPVRLFEKSVWDFADTTPVSGYAVTDDGERFLAVVRDRTRHPPPATIDVVFHWLDTLSERLRGAR